MPVEIRTSDGRHWARPAFQNHQPLPFVGLESRAERRRRRVRAVMALLILSCALLALLTITERALNHG